MACQHPLPRFCRRLLLQLSNVRQLRLTVHDWHDIGFSAPRVLLHLSLGLPHVEDVVLLDQSAADDYEPLETPTAAVAAAASYAASFFAGVLGPRPSADIR